VRIRRASQCSCNEVPGDIGLPDPALALPFPDRLRGVPPVAVQLSLTWAVDPAVRFAFPPECRARTGPRSPACASRRNQPRAPSVGFPSPSRHEPAASTPCLATRATSLHPGSLRSVLGVSHALDGLLRCRPRGFISPRSHVRDSSSGVFPRAQPYGLSTAVALLPFATPRCDHLAPPAFRAFLCARVRLRRMTV